MKLWYLLPGLVLGVGACGGGEPPAAPVAPAANAPAPQSRVPDDAAGSTPSSRDFSQVKACELVKGADVARIAQGTLLQDSGGDHPLCLYVVETTNGTESYRLAYAEPSPYQALLDYERADADVEVIPGLWDAAYLKPDGLSEGFVVIAVRRGDVAVEVKGPHKGATLEIARAAVAALQ